MVHNYITLVFLCRARKRQHPYFENRVLNSVFYDLSLDFKLIL